MARVFRCRPRRLPKCWPPGGSSARTTGCGSSTWDGSTSRRASTGWPRQSRSCAPRASPSTVRAIGGEILADSTVSWTERLKDLGVDVHPPGLRQQGTDQGAGLGGRARHALALGRRAADDRRGAAARLRSHRDRGRRRGRTHHPWRRRHPHRCRRSTPRWCGRWRGSSKRSPAIARKLAPLMEGCLRTRPRAGRGHPRSRISSRWSDRCGEQFIAVACRGLAPAARRPTQRSRRRADGRHQFYQAERLVVCVHEFS